MRFMRIDHMENGVPMLLDWKTMTVVPRIVVSRGDYQDPFDPTVWIAEEKPLDPEKVLEKNRRLLKSAQGGVPLTVGDLSWVTAQKRKAEESWKERKHNMDEKMTVGELFTTQIPESNESESQEILRRMQSDGKRRAEENLRNDTWKKRKNKDGLSIGELYRRVV